MRVIDRRGVIGGIAALGLAAPLLARGPASYPAPDREAMVQVEGGRIYVRVNGDLAGKPPLVIAHGGPGGTHGYYLGALALADERAVILYDQLDSGRSDRPDDPKNWRVERFVGEVDRIADALNLSRFHLLGHSWGGTIALEYAARRPARLASAILASPLISTRSWIADADALRTELPADTAAALAACERTPAPPQARCDAATAAFYAAYNGREPTSEAIAAYERDRAGGGTNRTLYRTMWGPTEFAATGTLKGYDGEPLLARLDGARTLFIGGQYDEARPATLLGFARRVPGAEFGVVPGAAHGIFDDRPAETMALVRAWCARKDAA